MDSPLILGSLSVRTPSFYVDVIKSEKNLKALIKESRCILAARSQEVIDDILKMEGVDDRIIKVPYMDLTRLSQIKIAFMMGLSSKIIESGDLLVCLSGSPTIWHIRQPYGDGCGT